MLQLQPDIWFAVAGLGLAAIVAALLTGRSESAWIGLGGGLILIYAFHLIGFNREILDFNLIFPIWMYLLLAGLALMLGQPVDRRLGGLGLIILIVWFFHVARIPFGGSTQPPMQPDAWMGLAALGLIVTTVSMLLGRDVSLMAGVGVGFIILYTLHLLGVPRAWLDIEVFLPLWVYLLVLALFMIFGRTDNRLRGVGIVLLVVWLFHVARIIVPGLNVA